MNQKNVTINITTGSFLKAVVIIGIFAVLFILRDLVLVILTAILLASAIEPATKWFVKNRIPRILAVLAVYLIGALILSVAFYFLIIPLVNETSNFLKNLPEYMTTLEVWNPLRDGFFGQSLSTEITKSFSIKEAISQVGYGVSGAFNFLAAAATFFGGILSFILIVVLSFFFAVQEGGVIKFLKLVTPIKYEDHVVDLWRRAEIKIGLWAQGQIVLAVIIGVLTYLGLLLLGVPNALLLAFLAAILELVPVFGPIISSVPAIILGFSSGGVPLALAVAGFYMIVQQFESQLIYPLVVKKIVGLSPIIVILALITGFKLAGFLGILLAVPLAAVFMVFIEDVEKMKQSARN